ncbi:hypothetical protein RB195_009862 [Necator americanus]|uniref:Uncharacterized protein n=1 Tax=Necator americanus TaxID=51031 RepID=A0ABR1CV97_NECAM
MNKGRRFLGSTAPADILLDVDIAVLTGNNAMGSVLLDCDKALRYTATVSVVRVISQAKTFVEARKRRSDWCWNEGRLRMEYTAIMALANVPDGSRIFAKLTNTSGSSETPDVLNSTPFVWEMSRIPQKEQERSSVPLLPVLRETAHPSM